MQNEDPCDLVDIDDVLEKIYQGIDVSHLLDRIDGFQVINMNDLGEIEINHYPIEELYGKY